MNFTILDLVDFFTIWPNHRLELLDDYVVDSFSISALYDLIKWVFTERACVAVFGPANDTLVAEHVLAFQKTCDLYLFPSEADATCRNIFINIGLWIRSFWTWVFGCFGVFIFIALKFFYQFLVWTLLVVHFFQIRRKKNTTVVIKDILNAWRCCLFCLWNILSLDSIWSWVVAPDSGNQFFTLIL